MERGYRRSIGPLGILDIGPLVARSVVVGIR